MTLTIPSPLLSLTSLLPALVWHAPRPRAADVLSDGGRFFYECALSSDQQ